MIENYTPSKKETKIRYRLLFYEDKNGGFSFDCDENGNLLDSVSEKGRENYKKCLQNPEKYKYAFNELEADEYEEKTEATGKCICGKRITLYDQYLGACACPKCGQWWTLFGQEIKPVERWNDCGELEYKY